MEIPEQTMKQMADQLGATMSLDKNAREQATAFLKSGERQPGFSIALLKLLSNAGLPLPVRLSSAIYFKNFLMHNWVPDGQENIISESDRGTVKQHVVELMLGSPKQIQAQLSQALAIVSREDFPGKWQSLLPELVSKLTTPDVKQIVGVLETAHSIFYRYRVESKGQKLWEEIEYVLGIFQAPLLKTFQALCGLVQQHQSNKEALVDVTKALTLAVQIFYDLNVQDIPEFFEDNMKEFMEPFKAFLQYNNPLLNPEDEDTAGVLDCLKAEICEAITLYTNKYEEQFKDWVPVFVSETWNLLSILDVATRYDQLVTTAIKFLTSVVRKAWNKELFNNEGTMKTICEKIIIPQIKLRESDVELFSMDGLEYIRRDIEGSDCDTRRRITMDFVQGLCTHFEAQITEILKQYVGHLLQEYAKDPKNQWILKDAAMYVVLALTVKGSTKKEGVTKTNTYINIIDFFGTQVLPELQSPDTNAMPVLKADCLKFISTFRNQLPTEAFPVLMPIVARYLSCDDFVLHTYAAHALERLMSVKDESGKPRFGRQQLQPLIQTLLEGLFKVLEHEESRENEYVMKTVMRICAVAEEDMAPLASVIIQKVTAILSYVSQNPKNPRFNHYLFETLSCLIRYVCKVNPGATDSFEQALFPPFQTMLSMETCQEFGPYCFQILAQLLEIRTTTSDPYKAIFPACLAPLLWDNQGNIPALVRLIQAYLRKPEAAEVVNSERLTGVLGIFQKLNASKNNDHYGFALLGSIFENLPLATLNQYVVEIFRMIFARLQTRKTPKYTEAMVVFMSRFVCKHGLDPLVAAMDQIQPQIFHMVLGKIWLPALQSISGGLSRRICAVALTKMLCKSPITLNAPYVEFWPRLCEGAVNMFELPQTAAAEETDILEQSANGFSASFSKLVFAPENEYDPVSEVKSCRHYLATSVNACVQQNPNQFRGLMGQVAQDHQSAMGKYMQGPPASPVKAR